MLAHEVTRKLPTAHDDITHETIHPSVLDQSNIMPLPEKDIAEHPELVHDLTPLEKQLRDRWPFDPNSARAKDYAEKSTQDNKTPSLISKALKIGSDAGNFLLAKAVRTDVMTGQGGAISGSVYEKTWFAKMVGETNLGPYLKAFEAEHLGPK
jgi:hypothetical protein